MANYTPSFPDHNQNFWQLACIQGVSQGVPMMWFGGALAKQYGTTTALISICVGNLLLWVIGLIMISMAAKGRRNIAQMAWDYLGKWGGVLVAILLMFAFILWYAIQIKSSLAVLQVLIPSHWDERVIGVLGGVIIAFLGTGGIRWIKKICVWCFPVLLAIVIWEIIHYERAPEKSDFAVSFGCVEAVVFFTMAGFVNFVTFFRHSHSKADSVLALSLIIVFKVLLTIPSIVMGISFPSDVFVQSSGVFALLSVVFVMISLVGVNLVNIYFASPGMEVIFPRLRAPWNYFCIGVVGSGIFVCCSYQWALSAGFLESFFNNCIVNLGVIFLMSFLVKVMRQEKLEARDKIVSSVSWLIGCGAALIVQLQILQGVNGISGGNRALLVGVWASMLSFLIAFFIQQFVFVIKKLRTAALPLE